MKAEDDESVRMNGIVCSRWIVSNNIPFVMKQKLEILNPLGTFIFVCLSNISVNTNKCADLITLQRSTEQRMNLSIRQMIQKDKVPKFYYGLYAYENEDQTPIPSLDNTFVDHTSDYKTQ
ncbi:hypothetical protein HID58_002751, partial [Brassica napus]